MPFVPPQKPQRISPVFASKSISAPQPSHAYFLAATEPPGGSVPAAGGAANSAPHAMHQRPGDGGAPHFGQTAASVATLGLSVDSAGFSSSSLSDASVL